ncbi:MAG: hypothetical protein IJH56_02700 [Firmicutes bacterium]|nr:hypothetical protein [Bacillota bacterium]
MTREIRCEICGGRLQAEAGGRFLCEGCGLIYSAERLRELTAADEAIDEAINETAEADAPAAAAPEDAEAAADGVPLTEKEQRLRQLRAEQRRLLAEIRLADGVFGPSRRRELSGKLRKVEREMARLQGRKWPFFF